MGRFLGQIVADTTRDDAVFVFARELRAIRTGIRVHEFRKIPSVFLVAGAPAFRGEIVLVPPLELGPWLSKRAASSIMSTLS